MKRQLRVLIADDHAVVREGARLLIEHIPGWQVCGLASNGPDTVEQALASRPDVIVLDLHMPELDGLQTMRALKRAMPHVELVIFTAERSERVIRELFEAGAKGFVRKTDEPRLLIAAVRSAAEHKPFFTPETSEVLFSKFVAPASNRAAPQLSGRERQVICHIADGKPNKQVGAALGISTRTAETHRAAIMRKLRVSSTAEIVRYAIRNRLVAA